MELTRNFPRSKNLIWALFPILGAVSLFWWSYTNQIPTELRALIGLLDASQEIGALLLVGIASAFFARITSLTFFYLISFAWDTLRTFPNHNFILRYKRAILYLALFRRKYKRLRVLIEASLTAIVFSLLVFEDFPFLFLLRCAASAIVIAASFRVLLFRISKSSATSLMRIPRGVSHTRRNEFWMSWAVTTALAFALFFGNELATQKRTQFVCMELNGASEKVAIIASTSVFVILAKQVREDQFSYFATPIAEVRLLEPCDNSQQTIE